MRTRWDKFLYWAARFRDETADFDGIERDYKIASARKSELALNAFEANESWLELIRKPLSVNLCNQYSAMAFREWVESDPVSLASALRRLWSEPDTPRDRINGFLGFAPSELPSARLAEPAVVLHMAMGFDRYPPYRSVAITTAFHMTGYPTFNEMKLQGDYGLRYEHVIGFFDRVFYESASHGLRLRDRLDAQSIVWAVTYWDPSEQWNEADRSRFLEYRKHAEGKSSAPQSRQ